MMKINIDRLMDVIREAGEYRAAYAKAAHDFYRRHGFRAYIDPRRGMDAESLEIYYKSTYNDRTADAMYACIEVLGLDPEQQERAYAAERALRRWYEQTAWQRCPSQDLLDRIGAWIFG